MPLFFVIFVGYTQLSMRILNPSGLFKISVLLILLACLLSPAIGQKKKKSAKKNEPLSEAEASKLAKAFFEGEKFFLTEDYDKSLEQFLKVLNVDPNNATASYKTAQIHVEMQDNIAALPYAVKAKQLSPGNKFYYILLANIYTSLDDLEMAAATYQELIDNVEGAQSYLLELAALQLYQAKYDDALETYTKALKFFGYSEDIILQKQKIYLKQNKLDLAIKEGEMLINSNPGESRYVAALSRILISNNRLEQAQAYLEKYIDDHGDHPIIGVQLAEIYRKNGEVKKAILILKSAFSNTSMDLSAKISTLSGYMAMLPNQDLEDPLVELAESLLVAHPESHGGHTVAGDLYYNLGRREPARKNYLRAIDINAANYNVWQNVISIELDMQEYANAVAHVEEALEYFPNQAALYYFGGTAHLIQKNYQDAIQFFNSGKMYTAANPVFGSLMNGQLGDAYNGIGDHDKSDRAYEEALKLNPENDHVLNNYSYFLSLRKKNMDLAEKMSTKLIVMQGENPTYLDTHGWVLYIREKYQDALIYLKKAATAEENATIIEHYGDVLFKLGDIDEALKQWKKALDLSDDKENLEKKIANKQLYE